MARLIDVDALLSELQTKFDRAERDAEFTGNREICIGWDDAICAIKQAPTVDAEPVKHGRWMVDLGDRNTGYGGEIVCSECGFIRDAYLLDISNYCPKCGAKMDGKENG